MTLQKPARKGIRLLLALLFTIAIAGTALAATQRSALAATCSVPAPQSVAFGPESSAEPTYYFSTNVTCTAGKIPATHRCVALGTYAGTQAVQCTDLYVNITASPKNIQVYGVGDFYCQGATTQCFNIDVQDALGLAPVLPYTGFTYFEYGSYACGVACPSSGQAQVGTTHVQVDPGSCVEAWTVDLAGNTIQVQGDTSGFQDTSNFGSSHVNLCF